MTRFRTVLMVATLCLPVAAQAQQDVDGSLAKLPKQDVSLLFDAFDLSLADGPSSRLRNVRAIEGRRICGLINSKNRMNAYTGYKVFLADLEQMSIWLDGEEAPYYSATASTALIKVACGV